jgi:hypothetical protein
MKRPLEQDYTSLAAYTRALEEYCDGLAQPEQPKVRTGNCLRVGVCASEGHKIQPQRTWVGSGDLEDSNVYLDSPTALKENT